MLALNHRLFLALNASSHPEQFVVWTADFAAQYLIYGVLAMVAALWIWGRPARRGALLAAVLAAALALGFNQLLGLMWYEPRPFMIGLGHSLLAHVPENSFPSDHATLVWALGAGLVATGASLTAGIAVGAAGLAIAWARVYLGVHFPIDMATSAAVALPAGLAAWALQRPVERILLPVAEAIYERALGVLNLSNALLPRQGRAERERR